MKLFNQNLFFSYHKLLFHIFSNDGKDHESSDDGEHNNTEYRQYAGLKVIAKNMEKRYLRSKPA